MRRKSVPKRVQRGAQFVALAYGRELEIKKSDGSDPAQLVLRAAGGELELAITIGPDGPKLRVRAVDIEIEAARALRMGCESFTLEATKSVDVRAGEDISLRAPAGMVSVRANDDVDIKGERVLLNADVQPMAVSWAELQRRGSFGRTER